mmetsp:Transcript_75105/g.147043  ORF Transcript_75105/g.147043 Transcript_75105/m.147043 type:complete len:372 (-) Transcript_75105:139-1254(-)
MAISRLLCQRRGLPPRRCRRSLLLVFLLTPLPPLLLVVPPLLLLPLLLPLPLLLRFRLLLLLKCLHGNGVGRPNLAGGPFRASACVMEYKMWHPAATVSTSSNCSYSTLSIRGTPFDRAMSAATGASCSIRSSTTDATRCRSTWVGCCLSTGSRTFTPPACAIFDPSPLLSDKMASAWHPDLTSSPCVMCSSMSRRMAPIAPASESLRPCSWFPTIKLASASNAKGKRTVLPRWCSSTWSMQKMPPLLAMSVWFCAFWHMLLNAPHALFKKSAVEGCSFMPRRMMGMPPCCPITSFSSGLLNARDHSRSHAASSKSCLSTCCSITEQMRRMPSRAMSNLFASSRDKIASTPQQVLRDSTCLGLSIILCKIS